MTHRKKTSILFCIVFVFGALWSCKGFFGLFGDRTEEDAYEDMNRFDIDLSGGTIEDESGLIIEIPAGAVSTDASIYIKQLDPADYSSLFTEDRIAARTFHMTFPSNYHGVQMQASFHTSATSA